MKNLYRFSAVMALALLFCATSLASDRAFFKVIGFSSDGKYFAYETYGKKDGSGSVYSSIKVIKVSNSECIKSYETEDFKNLNLDSVRTVNIKNARTEFAKYKLNENAKGTLDYRKEGNIYQPSETVRLDKKGNRLELVLTNTTKECAPQITKKTLTLSLKNGRKGKSIYTVAENDKLCVISARIERVIKYKKSRICILEYLTPGFEGMDVRQLAIGFSL